MLPVYLVLSAVQDPVKAEQIFKDVLNESGLPTETERTSNDVSSNDILDRIKSTRSQVEGKNKEANKFPEINKKQGKPTQGNRSTTPHMRLFEKVQASANLLQAQNCLEKLNEMNDSSSFAQGAPAYQPQGNTSSQGSSSSWQPDWGQIAVGVGIGLLIVGVVALAIFTPPLGLSLAGAFLL